MEYPIEERVRVSAATLCRVTLAIPLEGPRLLALERRVVRINDTLQVLAQPFGGGLRILDPQGLRAAIGDFEYDSPRSAEEQDMRIVIPRSAWEQVKRLCEAEFASLNPAILETSPMRELREELMETVGADLPDSGYDCVPLGTVLQDQPQPTRSRRAFGAPTVRYLRIFDVDIQDERVCAQLLESHQRYRPADLLAIAEANLAATGRARAIAALALPVERVKAAFQAQPAGTALQPVEVDGEMIDTNTAMLFIA